MGVDDDDSSGSPVSDKQAEGLRKAAAAERAKRQLAEEQVAQAKADADARVEEARRSAALEKERADKLAAEHAELTKYKTTEETRKEALRVARKSALTADLQELIPDGLKGDALDAHLVKLEARAATAKATQTQPPAAPIVVPPVVPAGQGGSDGGSQPSLIKPEETEWMKVSRPDWLRCPPQTQRHLLDTQRKT